jgi:hypothetical protein
MKIKHIGLILGLFLVIISFLFIGRQQQTYLLLLIVGLFVCLVFYLTILFSKGTVKSKLFWTVVIILAATLQWLSEPFLTKSSYLIFLNIHKIELNSVNKILLTKSGAIRITKDDIDDRNNQLTSNEIKELGKLREKLDVYIITKSNDIIYYGLYGFLDLRLGIVYWTKNEKPDNSYHLLTDNWYLNLQNN